MVTTPLGGSSDCRDGGCTGKEEEEVYMGEEEVDVIRIDDDKDDDDDDVDVDDGNDNDNDNDKKQQANGGVL